MSILLLRCCSFLSTLPRLLKAGLWGAVGDNCRELVNRIETLKKLALYFVGFAFCLLILGCAVCAGARAQSVSKLPNVVAHAPLKPVSIGTPSIVRSTEPISATAPAVHKVIKPKPTPRAGATRKIFNGGKHSLIKTSTTLSGNTGKITVSIELGMPSTSVAKVAIKSAPASVKFSELTWSNLDLAHLPTGTSLAFSHDPGAPDIPTLAVRLAIPDGSTGLRLTLANDRTADLTNAHLMPAINPKDESRTYTASYSGAHAPKAKLEDAVTFRTLHFVTLEIPLAEVLASGTLRARRSVTATLSFTTNGEQFAATRKLLDPMFEEAGLRMVANTSDLSRFQANFHRAASAGTQGKLQTLGSDSARTFDLSRISWIDRSAPYAKMSITRTGLYRVTALDIGSHTNSAALDLLNWSPSQIRVFNHGHEIPVWIDTSQGGHVQAVEFYGERLPGFPREYYNVATDTNVYWLTNSTKFNTAPLRYKDRAPSESPVLDLSTGTMMLHHEKDKFYFPGKQNDPDDAKTVQRTEWIPSRRFVWAELDPPNGRDTSRLIDSFNVTLPADTAGKTALFSAFLDGISAGGNTSPNHHYRISINGFVIADSTFTNYDSLFLQRAIPMGLLRNGTNQFQLVSAGTSNSLDRFLVDFYSLSLNESLAPSADTSIAYGQLLFTDQLSAGITNLNIASVDNVQLFSLTDTTRINARSSSNGVTSFRDSTNGANQVFAASTATGFLKADQIYGWNVGVAGQGWEILDSTKGADYIVLTHPLFKSAASKIEFFRKTQLGIRTRLVTTDEVFNAFNFGSNEPLAIQQFLHYAYEFYQGTPPGFVTLVGDAAWDPKKNLNTTIHNSYVPSFGDPVSDYVFTELEGTGFETLTPEMVIARIPVEDSGQANDYFNKLQNYSLATPAAWNKRFLFIVGGDGPLDQHSLFMSEVNAFLHVREDGGLAMPPMSISDNIIERTDFSQVDFTHEAEIQERIREGASFTYFAGHGAPNITDVSLGDPNLLRNNGPYTVFISLSCRTGAFAENDLVSINEQFLRAKDQGAIMTYGTSGFGEIGYDLTLSVLLWNLMDNADSSRVNYIGNRLNLATVFTLAKVAATFSDGGQLPLNSLNQYLILGDALTGFALRPHPELSVSQSDLTFSNSASMTKQTFSLSDSSITVAAMLHDFGYSTEGPVHVRIRDLGPRTSVPRDVILNLAALDSTATVSATFPIDTSLVGQHTISVFVDYDSLYREENENDNLATVGVLVNGSSVTTLYPPEGSRDFCDVSADSIHFVLLAPVIGAQSSVAGVIEIEMDTTSAFSNSRNVVTLNVQRSPVEIGVPRALLPISSSKVVWIRIRFTPPSTQVKGPWVVLSESIDQSTAPEFSYSTGDQLRTTIQDHLTLTPLGALTLPISDTTRIEVVSHGGNDTTNAGAGATSHLIVGKADSSVIGPFLTVAYLSQDGTAIESFVEIHAPLDGNDSENLAVAGIFDSLVKTIPSGRRVAVFTTLQPFFNSGTTPFYRNATVHADILSLGGKTGFDSTSYFGSYALLGIKGSQPGSAFEGTGPRAGAGVTLRDSSINFHTSGNAQTPFTAVASHYGKLSWSGSFITAHTDILFTVIGHNRTTSVDDTLGTFRASNGASFDLSQFDPRADDALSVAMHFIRDSSATLSPELSAISLEYLPAPEVTIDANSFTALPGSANEGVPIVSSYTIRNLTCVPVANLTSELEQTYHNTTTVTNTHAQISLAAHASIVILDTLQTFGLNGQVALLAYANPNELINEQFLLNDRAQTSFIVGRDTAKPLVDVTFDGRHVYNCDYVSNRPKISIALSDNSPIRLTDSTSISATLRSNNDPANPIYLSNTQTNPLFDLQFVRLPSGKVQAELVAKPNATGALKPDTWTLTAYAKDASGNAADTISICFVVAATNGLDHVMNVPNPFKEQTSMTYQLRSGGNADVKIVIYTIAGRKIRTLTPDPGTLPHAGINFMLWDGRDETGNQIANGTYLYRVVMSGANQDGSAASDAVTERAVKSR